MQVAVEATQGLERRMTVELPEEDLATEVDSRLKTMARSARIPGFRPGKVPMKVLVKRFGRQVRDEVVGELVRTSFADALEAEQLRPAGGPTIDPLSAELGQGLSYTAVFEVYPEIELAALEGLTVSPPVAQVTDADVDNMFDVLRRQRQTWEAAGRPAENGDRVTIDFVGTIDGEEFEGGKAEGFEVEVGQARLIPGFDEGLVGAGDGDELDLDLEFPAEYHSEELAGKPVRFHVVVKSVDKSVLPEIDGEFIRSFGVEDGEMESFRTEVRQNMERELEKAVRAQTKERVMDALLEANEVEVPNALIEEESARLLNMRRQEMANMGIDPARIELTPEAFVEQASRRVRLGLILAEVVKLAELRADPMAVREEVERVAAPYEDPGEVINWFYGEPGRLSEIESQVLEDAAMKAILERAQVSEETSSFDALLNPGQTTDR